MKRVLIILTITCLLQSCDESPEFSPHESFVRVINDPSSSFDYHPVAIRQSDDGGYLILGAYNEWQTYLMKINSQGRFVWERILPENNVNPVGEFFVVDDSVHFMCMDAGNRSAKIFRVNEFEQQIVEYVSYSGLTNPLDIRQTSDGNLLVLSHQEASNASGLSLINQNFSQEWGRLYETGGDYKDAVENSMRRKLDPLPFFAGEVGNGSAYYFNGFFEDNLSLVFANNINGEFTGKVEALGSNRALSGLLHLEGNNFFANYYSFNNFFISSGQGLITNAAISIDALEGNSFADLKTFRKTILRSLNIGGREVVCMLAQTKDLRVRLSFYNPTNGTLISSQVLGQGNPFDIVDVQTTRDGGIVLLGSTRIAGRISRLLVIKLASSQVLS